MMRSMPDEAQPSTDTAQVAENYAASIPTTVPPITRVREQPGEPVQPSTDASWFPGDPRTLPLT
jgi:hypothetical protein